MDPTWCQLLLLERWDTVICGGRSDFRSRSYIPGVFLLYVVLLVVFYDLFID